MGGNVAGDVVDGSVASKARYVGDNGGMTCRAKISKSGVEYAGGMKVWEGGVVWKSRGVVWNTHVVWKSRGVI